MIDIHRERLLPVNDVPAYLEARGLGRRVSQATIYRWIGSGIRGVRLETVIIGGHKVTSLEALQRWIEARSTASSRKASARNSVESPNAAAAAGEPTPEHRASVHLLTEHRVIATEIDRLIDTLDFPESTRMFTAGVLFRAGLRSLDDVRREGLNAMLAIPKVGKRSEALLRSLWKALSTRSARGV